MHTTATPTQDQDRKHVGAVLDRRYVLVEPTGRDAAGARFIAYDMQQMTHVDVVVQRDDNGDLTGDVVTAGGPDEARAVPAAFRPGGLTSPQKKCWPPKPAKPAAKRTSQKSPAVLALLAAGRPRPSFLQTLQLSEADLIEVGLLDRPGGVIQPDVLHTLQLSEADLIEVGLLEGDAPRPLLLRGADELAAIERQFRRLLRRRAWVVGAAVLGLCLVASVVWMLCRGEPAPGPAVVRSAAPAQVHPTQGLQHAVKRASKTLQVARPAAQAAKAAKAEPVAVPRASTVAKEEQPVTPPPAVKKAPPAARSVARAPRRTKKVAKQSPRRRARPAAKPRVRRPRRRAVDADALLAGARRPRRGGIDADADAILASAWASTRRARSRRLQRKTVDPFAE